jgi:hypothetical protein
LAERTTFSEVIERYVEEATSKSRGKLEHTYQLKALARHPIGKLRMTALTPIKVAEYRDERAKTLAPATVIHELALKGKAVCGHHGGYSTGPRSKEGKDRIQAKHLKHGGEILEAKAEPSAKSVMFKYLIDLGNYVGLFIRRHKTRGRTHLGYT